MGVEIASVQSQDQLSKRKGKRRLISSFSLFSFQSATFRTHS